MSNILFPSKYPLVGSEGNSELTMYDPERNKSKQVKCGDKKHGNIMEKSKREILVISVRIKQPL